MMAEAALNRICQRMGISAKRLTASGLGVLLKHNWPGNIRELENVLERAAAFSAGSDIGPEELIFNSMSSKQDEGFSDEVPRRTNVQTFVQDNPRQALPSPVPAVHNSHSLADTRPQDTSEWSLGLAGKSLDVIEREAIQQTLAVCKGNKAKSARMLGISEKSIYNKMRRLNVEWPPASDSLQV